MFRSHGIFLLSAREQFIDNDDAAKSAGKQIVVIAGHADLGKN